ncbi:TetR/AcrR family transcriptional regulator [Aliivibrio finisterrensis]|uniref:TetR/AcrR family transcriptional regulator n=1 Tax=Aliivibrio finisterrensis TaxID=511998 RepID=A0A4Q5KJH3_9GAMM|nr:MULTISPECIES: TetR/AcrR family transcriptional regulator [Aliivibrio]MDD9175606.1 TetR/AcrR family transcriptional regulator [Aliivibrio sp. S3TY1]MDD9192820.1 TetR/AcrR family transcriptional regulator [Aliivibrio sp. S2TY2]RYU45636.1 TetR/AcrR family transcriptional regulator [Aliivibrio finisterrensis]RYU70047.1 TetR/AcrR family transcriptional regulator [Aliivibrio finisterrensis]RYU73836.1 TetR/AcrR family transcriptional regulator [Aliivibrio finisterrensis]
MDTIQKRPRTRLSPEKRKEQLLDIAIEVFSQRGIGRGGHADVAEIAQVSVATVFNYFPTREDLVDDVLNKVEEQFHQFVQNSISLELDVRTNLHTLLMNIIDTVQSGEKWIKVWFEWSTSTREEVWPLFLSTHVNNQKIIRTMFEEGIERNEVCNDHTPENLAKMLHGICYSVFIQANRSSSIEELEDTANCFLNMLCIYK